MLNTFSKGVHPHGCKELSRDLPITEMPAPATAYFPLTQHVGAPAEQVVKNGESVKIGTLLARASGFVSSNIFSSVSGVVKGTQMLPLASGQKAPHIIVENDFADTVERLPKLNDPTPVEIVERLRACGIVGMGGAGFPTDVKLTPPDGKSVDILVINAAECEPYITCDYRIMLEYTEQIIKGTAYLMNALNVSTAVIGIEANKLDAADRLNLYLKNNNICNIKVLPLKVKYPQGAEKQLIYAATRRKVPTGGLPVDIGVIVQNVHTALASYFAVWDGQPLTRRVMTVTGNGCARPANLWVRTGTLVKDILAYCGFAVADETVLAAKAEVEALIYKVAEAKKAKSLDKADLSLLAQKQADLAQMADNSVAKVISGGPMMGVALLSDMTASTKTMSCLLLMTHEDAVPDEISQCINCGKCSASCPMYLMPMYIDSYALTKDWEGAKKYGTMDCILCGCCSFVCPSKRPLVQSIAYAKKIIKERKI